MIIEWNIHGNLLKKQMLFKDFFWLCGFADSIIVLVYSYIYINLCDHILAKLQSFKNNWMFAYKMFLGQLCQFNIDSRTNTCTCQSEPTESCVHSKIKKACLEKVRNNMTDHGVQVMCMNTKSFACWRKKRGIQYVLISDQENISLASEKKDTSLLLISKTEKKGTGCSFASWVHSSSPLSDGRSCSKGESSLSSRLNWDTVQALQVLSLCPENAL